MAKTTSLNILFLTLVSTNHYNLANFEILNKTSSTKFCNPPKKIHFLANLSILGVAVIWALKSRT